MATAVRANPHQGWGWQFWTPIFVIVLAGAISTTLLRGGWAEFGHWLHEWETLIAGVIGGGLTLAAGILAYRGARGATEQQIAEDKARAREVERAYVSGGGWRYVERVLPAPGEVYDLNSTVSLQANGTSILLVPRRRFELHINNHGKTPARLHHIAVGFCDASKPLPPEPVYGDPFLHRDVIGPGQQSRVLKIVEIPPNAYAQTAICGRYYWDDIWDRHWSSGFLYQIASGPAHENGSISIEAPAKYWDDRPGDYPLKPQREPDGGTRSPAG